MTDSNQPKKKKRVTFIASEEGLKKANIAYECLGFSSRDLFAAFIKLSRTTVDKFFYKQPIQIDSFIKVCKGLNLVDWKEIAEFSTKNEYITPMQSKQADCVSNVETSLEPGEIVTLQLIPIDEKGKEVETIALVLEGDINSAKFQKVMLFCCNSLQEKYPGLKIKDIKPGSIKLIIEGSPEDIERILADFKSGELVEIKGFPVKDIQILTEALEDDESSEQKWRLVEEIHNNSVEGRDLSNCDLSDADLRNSQLLRANLRDADLSNCDLSDANLSDADLRGADLSNVSLKGANLRGANFMCNSIVTYKGNDLIDTYRSYVARLSNATDKFRIGKLSNNDLRFVHNNANLSGANLNDADLSNADLSGADLSNANLSGANLNDANLSNTDLSNADLSNANLSGANLNDADLSNADLSDADLSDADLSNADLSNTNLSNAQIQGARFGANLGISEEMKQDLISRGAIFEDSSGDRSPVPTPH